MNREDNKGTSRSKKKPVSGSPPPEAKATLPIAIGTKPQPQNMEVHHHPQLEHKHKPWKEYLLEGFMIFVAVMMGFIAENIREDITNREHARQLTSQLVRDLKDDTSQLNKMYNFETQIAKRNDSLFGCLQQPMAKADIKKIEQLAVNSHGMWPFHPAMGAIGAIKNELHLKQFSDSEIIKYISRYEGHVELLHTVQDITLQYQRNLLEPFLRRHFTPDNLKLAFSHSPVSAEIRNLNQEDLTQLGTDMVLIQINCQELLRDNLELKKDAVSLLQYVIKQYDLDNE